MKSLAIPVFLALSFLSPFKFISHLFHATPIDTASASVLRITGERDKDSWMGTYCAEYTCSAFQIARFRALTAAHCTGEKMLADGKPVKVLKEDKYFDLALLETDGSYLKPVVVFRDEPVERFEELTAIGYGFGWTRLSVMKETVFLTDYAFDAEAPVGIIVQGGYIGGMSGGPVVDSVGRVVSIAQRGSEVAGYGVGTLIIRTFLLGEDLDALHPQPQKVIEKDFHNNPPLPELPFYSEK